MTWILFFSCESLFLTILLTAFCTNAVCTKSGGHLKSEKKLELFQSKTNVTVAVVCKCYSIITDWQKGCLSETFGHLQTTPTIQHFLFSSWYWLSWLISVTLHLSDLYSISSIFFFICCPSKAMFFSPTVVSGLLTNLSTLFASILLPPRWYTN